MIFDFGRRRMHIHTVGPAAVHAVTPTHDVFFRGKCAILGWVTASAYHISSTISRLIYAYQECKWILEG